MLRLAAAFSLLSSTSFANGYSVGDTFADPMQIATEALAAFSMEEEGRPGIEVNVSVDFFGQMTILIAETGFADDSVAGLRRQYVLAPEDGMWTLIFQRRDQLCYRGANTVTWQAEPCL